MNIEFIKELDQILQIFTTISQNESRDDEIINFASKLQETVSTFSSEYLIIIREMISKTIEQADEEKILEYIIPIWASERGKKIPQDKSVDDFYYEFEMITLWTLLTKFVKDDEIILRKMRSIIRRYSNMPVLWQYLCELSGDKPIDAYTF